jgi:hypothetical protein
MDPGLWTSALAMHDRKRLLARTGRRYRFYAKHDSSDAGRTQTT